ncbi:MAG: tetratricopeptide repeat protein [Spirulinaceae cyanobacterium RM2_2_10]|nr:tetratricopeptide repeat protein [Spirulinaceae cyanobacterium RM2_2_10]
MPTRWSVLAGLSAVLIGLGQPELALAQREERTLTGKLSESSPVLESDGSYFDLHEFVGRAGEQVSIELRSQDFDAYLILLDDAGNKLAEDNDSGDGSDAWLIVTLPANGTYAVMVNTLNRGETGRYQLSWQAATGSERPATGDADLGAATAGQLFQQGIQQFQRSQLQAALATWEQALALYRAAGDRHGEASTLGNLGIVYDSLGEYQRAIDFHQQIRVDFPLAGRATFLLCNQRVDLLRGNTGDGGMRGSMGAGWG